MNAYELASKMMDKLPEWNPSWGENTRKLWFQTFRKVWDEFIMPAIAEEKKQQDES